MYRRYNSEKNYNIDHNSGDIGKVRNDYTRSSPLPHGSSPPNGPYGPPHNPHFFGPHPTFGQLGGHFDSPLPMSRESFKEMKHFIILLILSDNPKGITGYQFQGKFHFPRGNLLRTLEELEIEEYISTKEDVIKGRAQKFFTITEKGTLYLEKLKERLTNQLAMMSNMAPPEEYNNPFLKESVQMLLIKNVEDSNSLEDALDLFRGLRSHLKIFLSQLEKRKEKLEMAKSELDNIIKKVENMDSLNIDLIKDLIKKSMNKVHQD